MNCCNDGQVLFKARLLSNEAGVEAATDTAVFPMHGQDITIQAMIYNIGGAGADLALQLLGSSDGKVWRDIGAPINRGTFGEVTGTIANVTQRFLKLKCTFSTTSGSGSAIFDLAINTFKN